MYAFDPLVPRPIDLPTGVPLEEPDLVALDEAKIFIGPADVIDRDAWRAVLHRWRDDARARHGFDGAAYDRPEAAWAANCFTVAQVWLWDELFYSFEERRFTPERFLDDARDHYAELLTGARYRRKARIRATELGERAGMLGAAALARDAVTP